MKKLALLLAITLVLCTPLTLAETLVSPMHPGPQNPLTDNLYDFRFVMENVLYELPTSYETFTAAGWEVKNKQDLEDTLTPNQYTFSVRLVNNANFETREIYVSFFNNDNCVKKVGECPVAGITIETASGDKPQIAVVLPKGIEKGISTQEDIVAAYGNPTNLYEGSSYNCLTYETESYRNFKLYVENGVLNKVEARNFVDGETQSPVSEDVPQYILDYEAPAELGEDITGFVVSFNGDLYKLPAPISAFVANGYAFQSAKVESVPAKDSPYGGVVLTKDNQNYKFYTRNYADVAVLPENCAVYEIEVSSYDEYELILPGNIQKGMAKADLEALIGSLGFERTEQDKYWRYYFKDDNRNTIEIIVSKENEQISGIEVSAR